jgi:hypothetical protein
MTVAKVGTTVVVFAFVYCGLWDTELSSVSEDPTASIFREPKDENENDKVS